MIKLFISLYLAVVVGLLTINWGSELLWSSLHQQEESAELQHAITLVKALPALLENNPDNIQRFEQNTGLDITQLHQDDIAWLPEQNQQLQQGQVVVNYSNNNQALLYVLSSNQTMVYQLTLNEANANSNSTLKYLILTLSYLLLAAFIALWTRPLWRDLLKLKHMANQIAAGNLAISCYVNKRSPTAIVVQTFQDMANRVTRLLSEQTQLVNAVSHELRTPLSRLHFSIAMMDQQNIQQVADINQDVQEIESLIEELLNYSRIETLEKIHSKTQVNLSELLTNQVEKHQRATNKKLTLAPIQQPPLTALCNGHLIERALQNLITNALRYAKTTIIINASYDENTLIISVNDDGPGIPEKDREKVFHAFTRLDKSRNKAGDNQQTGFGLGLAIVKRIMDWHNGSCAIEESTLGGAKFTLRFEAK